MPEFKQFVTCHSHPSSLDSASTPEAFAKREVELGSGALTCTDHGSLAAAYQVYELAHKHHLTPCIGLEAYFRDDSCPILLKLGIERTHTVPRGSDRDEWLARYPQGTFFDYLKYYHVTLGFLDYPAYLCAVRLLSKADERAELHGSERKPLFDWAALEELASHSTTATSSCLIGMTQRHLMAHENGAAARAYFERLHHLFGDRFYAELFPHRCTHDYVKAVFLDLEGPEGKETVRYHWGKRLRTTDGEITAEQLAATHRANEDLSLVAVKNYRKWEDVAPKRVVAVRKVEDFVQNECRPAWPDGDVQRGCNQYVQMLARKHDVTIIIGDDSHFTHPEEKIVQDVRLAQHGPWKFHNSYHRQSSAEAWDHFSSTLGTTPKEFESWVDNSHAWRDRFRGFKFDTKPDLPTKFFPADSLQHTKELIKHHGRMVNDPRYVDRLKAEIELLHRNGTIDLLPYWFTDEEVCRLYENQGLLTGPGRGSAAGMLLTYLLGITHVDPIRYGLSMERFITDTRIKSGRLPDIDQDLATVEPLVGWETDVVEFQADDGTKHVVPEDMRFDTDQGLMTIREAALANAELKPWWLEKNALPNPAQ